jgi:hypothetical protein
MPTFAWAYRWAFGLLALAAVGTGFWHSVVHNGFSWVSYFSFFTILSNILALVLLLAGTRAPDFRSVGFRSVGFRSVGFLRGAATVYMVITGIVYQLLLSQYPVNGPAWVNNVEHRIMPVVVLLDWLLMPHLVRIGIRRAMWWLVVPVVYVAYSEVRGPYAHWYPYPFLDPRPHGVVHVVVYSIAVGLAFVAVSVLVAFTGDRLSDRRSAARG